VDSTHRGRAAGGGTANPAVAGVIQNAETGNPGAYTSNPAMNQRGHRPDGGIHYVAVWRGTGRGHGGEWGTDERGVSTRTLKHL